MVVPVPTMAIPLWELQQIKAEKEAIASFSANQK